MTMRGGVILALLTLAAAMGQAQRKSVSVPSVNLTNCLKGLAGCDVSELSPDELKQTSEASKKRNLDSCLAGSTLCDPTRLSNADATAVQAARYQTQPGKMSGWIGQSATRSRSTKKTLPQFRRPSHGAISKNA